MEDEVSSYFWYYIDGDFFAYLFLCLVSLVFFFFFFSSRRRHTRSLRDWSSDVCSSDLPQNLVRRVLLQAEQAQRGAALSRAVERGLRRVAHDLLRQRGAVDDHRVHAACLGDQRRERAVAPRERAVDRLRGLDRAREHDARDPRIG